MSTDHSPILFSFSKNPETTRGNGLSKFNNSLCSNIDYTTKLKNHIKLTQKTILKENITHEQMIWEYIKYEIKKFSIGNKEGNKEVFQNNMLKINELTKTFILEKN